MVRRYIPDRGDIAWVTLNPRRGHEQRGRRPVLVLSIKHYNKKAQLAVICPITSPKKNYPFEVAYAGRKTRGSILADQIRSLDWAGRKISFIERVDAAILQEVQQKALLLITGT